MKSLLPSLKEKTRYIAFEIISEKAIKDFKTVEKAIKEAVLAFIGQLGLAKANLILIKDCWLPEKQRGIIKVNNQSLNEVKMSLALIKEINSNKTIINCIGVSGILNKAKKRYLEV